MDNPTNKKQKGRAFRLVLRGLLLSALFLSFNPGAQAAPEPEEIAASAPQYRKTIAVGGSYTCVVILVDNGIKTL